MEDFEKNRWTVHPFPEGNNYTQPHPGVSKSHKFLSPLNVHFLVPRKVTEALERQIRKLWHTTHIYLQPEVYKYTEKLLERMPGNLKVWHAHEHARAHVQAHTHAHAHTCTRDREQTHRHTTIHSCAIFQI